MATRIERVLTSLRSVYGQAPSDLHGLALAEAIRFGVSNGLTVGRVAREFGVSREYVAEACKQLDVPIER